MCASVCGTCWNTVLGIIGTHCAEVRHGLPVITQCRALWTFVFILIAERKFSFSLSWLQNDGYPHLWALGFVYLQPVLALVTTSVVSLSFLMEITNYKTSPWPHAVTRKHILPPFTHSLLEVITGCVNSIHTVGSHVLQWFHCSLSCAMFHSVLWDGICGKKMCWGIKISLL
jgi:hypothetical protein